MRTTGSLERRVLGCGWCFVSAPPNSELLFGGVLKFTWHISHMPVEFRSWLIAWLQAVIVNDSLSIAHGQLVAERCYIVFRHAA
jgi:hypothetical protein